jgi:hypothetical protein
METTMLDLFDTVEVIKPPMSTAEAQDWKRRVGKTSTALRVLLFEGYERQAWIALGFANWTDCLTSLAEEFEINDRYAWRLHRANQIEKLLAPGPVGEIPEKHLRPLTSLPPDLQREAWREAQDTAPNGKVTGAHVQAVVDKMTKPEPEAPDYTRALTFMADNVSLGLTPTGEYEPKQRAQQAMGATVYSHNSLDYYTPQYVTDAARAVMGGIDLDPASCEMAQAWIKAAQYYTITDDGLSKPWAGRVWLNPPYSYTDGRSNQDLWSERLVTHYLQGDVTEGLLLVKAALGYKWFERLWDVWPVCFMRERLSFVMADGSDDGQSKQATAIFYIGPNVSKFVDVFRLLGRVILPEDQKYG